MATLPILKYTYPDHVRSLPPWQNSPSYLNSCLYKMVFWFFFSVLSALVCRNPSANLAREYNASGVPSLGERRVMLHLLPSVHHYGLSIIAVVNSPGSA